MKNPLTPYRFFTIALIGLLGCASPPKRIIHLDHGKDVSAGGAESYIIKTPTAVYYLDKVGGGLSSMIDKDGVDWLGFHNAKGSGHKGEYRGFPNAIHKQDGSYFHAMNAGTAPSISTVKKESASHIQISYNIWFYVSMLGSTYSFFEHFNLLNFVKSWHKLSMTSQWTTNNQESQNYLLNQTINHN